MAGRAKSKRRTANDSDAASKRATAIDARIGSLKILAQSLMRQIEFLEKEADSASTSDLDAQSEVRRFEAELIRSALIRTGGRQRRAARLLGMKVTTLNTKIRRYRITLDKNTIVYEKKSEILPERVLEVS
jgi:DNA-binding NtrC family response regulator